MSEPKTRVLIVGGGPSGLAAAARLLEEGESRVSVRLATLGHHFGGKADSWRDAEGRLIDHGQHVVVGWYTEMKALLGRAGVDVSAHLVDNGGHTYVYEPRDGQVHDLELVRNPIAMLFRGLGFSGLSSEEKSNIAWFVISNFQAFFGTQDIEQFDDVCFTTWCLENGLLPSIVTTNAFLMSRTAQLNWPGEISTYSLLKAVREVGRDARSASYSFCDGGMSEVFWEPLVRYIAKLGGRLETMRKLLRLHLEGGRLSAVTLAEPDSAGHELPGRPTGLSPFEQSVPTKPGRRFFDDDFDHVICTIPATALQDLNPGDPALWSLPEFAKIKELRGVAPLALQVWHREHVTKCSSRVVAGLDGPLGFVVDNKHVIREYRYDPRYGAVLYFVGQEAGAETWSDERLLEKCLQNLTTIPGFERIDRAGVIHFRVIRNRSPDKLYFYTEPGIQKFRPHPKTSIPNFWLAGDWVRSELDFPCMEAAIRSGMATADLVLEFEG
ncbi:MAG: FAD-dependent oxidoreductase [Deltaproteobacteria bacterium]|nr:FAD-dependent oxidoreductase [Deltaproteobacteria bacterium]